MNGVFAPWARALAVSVAAAAFSLTPIASATAAPGKKPVATAQKRAASVKTSNKKVVARKAAGKSVAKTRAAAPKVVARNTRTTSKKRVKTMARPGNRHVIYRAPASFGHQAGLHRASDELELASASALVIDQDTGDVLYHKNARAVLPIASITKLMTGMVIASANLSMDEPITITEADVDTLKHSSSRLQVGTTLTRGEMMHLALMSSENRAAHALARTFPGGEARFVALMNQRAQSLGMTSTHYVEPTGLSSDNQSSARDLAVLVGAAYQVPLLRRLTTSRGYEIEAANGRMVSYHSSNGLLRTANSWNIGLQKTGYIREAGHCMVLQTSLQGRRVIMVLLDSQGSYSRVADANRVRQWLEQQSVAGASIHDSSAS